MARKKKTRERVLIKDCEWAFRCPMTWQTLMKTNQPDVRFCDHCVRKVHLCTNPEALARARNKRLCVAIPLRLAGLGDDPDGNAYLVGDPSPRGFKTVH